MRREKPTPNNHKKETDSISSVPGSPIMSSPVHFFDAQEDLPDLAEDTTDSRNPDDTAKPNWISEDTTATPISMPQPESLSDIFDFVDLLIGAVVSHNENVLDNANKYGPLDIITCPIDEFHLTRHMDSYPTNGETPSYSEFQVSDALKKLMDSPSINSGIHRIPSKSLDGKSLDGIPRVKANMAALRPDAGYPHGMKVVQYRKERALLAASPMGKLHFLSTVVHSLATDPKRDSIDEALIQGLFDTLASVGIFSAPKAKAFLMARDQQPLRSALETIAKALKRSWLDIPSRLFPRVQPARNNISPRRGMENPDNLCYALAGVQFLFACPQFTQAVASQPHQSSLSSSLCAAWRSLSHPVGMPVPSLRLKEAIDEVLPEFRGMEQHDSHEFMMLFFHHLDKFLHAAAVKEGSPRSTLPTDKFRVELTTVPRCISCPPNETASKTEGHELCLEIQMSSVDDVDSVRLEGLLCDYFAVEQIECHCSKCGGDKSNLVSYISCLPEHLMVHLKRSLYVGDNEDGHPLYEKIDTPVVAPNNLSLAEYMLRDEEEFPQDNISANYRLGAILFHVGDSEKGHYLAAEKVGDCWIVANDGEVYPNVDDDDIKGLLQFVNCIVYHREAEDNPPESIQLQQALIESLNNQPDHGNTVLSPPIEHNGVSLSSPPAVDEPFRTRGLTFSPPRITQTMSDDTEDSTPPKTPADYQRKYAKMKLQTKTAKKKIAALEGDKSMLLKTNATQTENFSSLVDELKLENKRRHSERKKEREAAEEERKRRDIAGEEERKRRDIAGEEERKRRDVALNNVVNEAKAQNARQAQERSDFFGIIQGLVDGKSELKTSSTEMAGAPVKTKVSSQRFTIVVSSAIAGLPSTFSVHVEPSATVHEVKEAIASHATHRIPLEYQLLLPGRETKFDGGNELGDDARVSDGDQVRMVFQIGAKVVLVKQQKTEGVGTVESVDSPKKNSCKVKFENQAESTNKFYSSLTWATS